MRIGIIGQKWLASTLLEHLARGHQIVFAAAPSLGDRLATTARPHNVPIVVTGKAGWNAECAELEPELIIAAHATVKVGGDLLEAAGCTIGYHPSLLPLYPGRTAVQDQIDAREKVVGGTVFQLTEELDAGPAVFADWCFARPGESAAELWRRALGPMGLELLLKAAEHYDTFGFLPSDEQERLANNLTPALRETAGLL